MLHKGVTHQVADFVAETKYGDMPAEAVERAKLAILDCLGVALAGAAEPVGEKVARLAGSLGGSPQATVLAAGIKTSAPQAALANGAMAHALDYDDTSPTMLGHPSVALVPAVLALAEMEGRSGADVLTCYILGFEVQARLGAALNPGLCDAGWHSTDVLGSIGAAAAGAKVLGLDASRTAMSMAISAAQAGGFLHSSVGTMLKPLQAGLAARNGVLASIMARDGFTAPIDIFEAPRGFCSLFKGEGTPRIERVVQGLGQPFDIVSPGMGLKAFPSCLATHGGIEATLALMRERGIVASDVASVDCFVDYYWEGVLHNHHPRTALEAKFSMQFCVAIALLEDAVGLAQFTDEKVSASRTQELMQRISLNVHPDLRTPEAAKTRFTLVAVRLKDGRELSKRVDAIRGQPELPLTPGEVTQKYTECASLTLSPENVRKSVEALVHLEDLADVRGLMDLLAARTGLPAGQSAATR